ncbi:MAG: hypothetical protein AAGN46_02695 [Acidobacteriota bacterium]
MLESARHRVEAIPGASPQVLLSAATLASFGWLLAQDRIPAFLMYVLQVYLTF